MSETYDIEKFRNTWSLIIGVAFTAAFGLLWLTLAPLRDDIFLALGVAVIILAIGQAGRETIPIQHRGFLLFLNKRTKIFFEEGEAWSFPLITRIKFESAKIIPIDVPLSEGAITTDKFEIQADVWIWIQVINPSIYNNLENPEKTVVDGAISKSQEAEWEYITTHTYNQCIKSKGKIQAAIKERASTEEGQRIEERWGVRVRNVDVRSVKPPRKVLDGLAEDKVREIDVKRHTKSMKEILKAAPGLKKDPKTLANTAFIAEGRVKKEIKEERKITEFGVKPETLETLIAGVKLFAQFLPKKKEEKDEPEEKTSKGGKK